MTKTVYFAQNTTDVRYVFENDWPVATITKMENGHYRVLRLYDKDVIECDTYKEARETAFDSRVTHPATEKKRRKAG